MRDDGVIFATTVFEHLAQAEDRRFKKHFGNDTSGTEYIHRPCEVMSLQLLGALNLLNESFGRDVARSPAGQVEEIRVGGRIIVGQLCWLERTGKVCKIQPVPRCYHDVFCLDIAMVDIPSVAIAQGAKQLKGQPFLFDVFKKGSR